eukprot:8962303-Alexandrium_andersonii.AAC.1
MATLAGFACCLLVGLAVYHFCLAQRRRPPLAAAGAPLLGEPAPEPPAVPAGAAARQATQPATQ